MAAKFRLKGINNVNTTTGVIWKQLLIFALPILFSNFLQQLYNTIDLLIVGNYAGDHSLGAVGSTGAITNLLVGLFVGVSIGASVAVAQAYGAANDREVYKTVHSTLFVALVSGAFLTVFGLLMTEPLLILMKTPDVQLPEAVTYMRIIFVGMIPMSIYNMSAAILRAVGDSARPLIFLIISAVINLVLDLLFVALLDMGVAGAAWATVIAQVVTAVLGVLTLMRADTSYRLFLKEIKPYKAEILKVLKIGLPAGMQSVVISLANTIIQSNINNYGPNAVEGYAAAGRIDGFYYMAVNSFTLALTTFVGQNIGAGRHDRARKGVKVALLMASSMAAVMGVIFFFTQTQLLGIFNVEPASEIYGRMMMTIGCLFYWIFAFGDVLTGAFRGAGKAAFPMIASLINMCLVRIVWIYFAQKVYADPLSVFLAFPVSWVLQAALMLIFYNFKLIPAADAAIAAAEEKKAAMKAEEAPHVSLDKSGRRSMPLPDYLLEAEKREADEEGPFMATQRHGIYVDPRVADIYADLTAEAGQRREAEAEASETAEEKPEAAAEAETAAETQAAEASEVPEEAGETEKKAETPPEPEAAEDGAAAE